MAVDTKQKRASALNAYSPWVKTLPEPSSSVDADDRAHALMLYSGLSSGAYYPSTITLTMMQLTGDPGL